MSSALGDIVSVGSFGLIDGGDLTGDNAADAARGAANAQAAATNRAIDLQRESRDLAREDLAPFVAFGSDQMNALNTILTPDGQYEYVQNNPFYQLGLDNLNTQTLNNQAAQGKLGSGDTLNALQNNAMLAGLPLLQNQQNQLFNAVNLGQSAAAGQANTALNTGNNLSNLAVQQGNNQAAGIVGAQGAQQAAFNNLLNLGGGLGSAALLGSDERLKTDIVKVGEDEHGNIYEFSYRGVDKRYRGRIAQELREVHPEAVTVTESGYLHVSEEFAAREVA